MKRRYPSRQARVSPFHEWLVQKYMGHPTQTPRVGGWIIGLHHDPTLENPAAGILVAVAWEKTRYPLRSVGKTQIPATQRVSRFFSLQHCPAGGICQFLTAALLCSKYLLSSGCRVSSVGKWCKLFYYIKLYINTFNNFSLSVKLALIYILA